MTRELHLLLNLYYYFDGNILDAPGHRYHYYNFIILLKVSNTYIMWFYFLVYKFELNAIKN